MRRRLLVSLEYWLYGLDCEQTEPGGHSMSRKVQHVGSLYRSV